ncbi:MAG: cofactor-independent phosphoglycerate mutase [Candidatus Hydrogenedentes bacterium]|nr:cofactor-independent phosphoglycerate mutase [Candidatus Hydrogenedentota bacterium]
MLKNLILVGDGMADFPLPELDGRTPLEVGKTPSMDQMARSGITGLFCPIPEGLPPGSDIGNLSLFGYNPRTTFSGRAPLEAARQGILLSPDEVAFRCNLVTLQDGTMVDFTSGHIANEEAHQLIQSLNQSLPALPAKFHPGVSYRHLAIVSARGASVEELVGLKCTPPHDITGQAYAPHLPAGPGADVIHEIMQHSQAVLQNHQINLARRQSGKPPATSVWLWGQGRSPSMENYSQRFGLAGAVISAVDLVKGIGVCAGLEVVNVPGATGYLDTDYAGKTAAALEALERLDFVYLHVEAPDEVSHEGRIDLKIQAIEDFDAKVVGPCLEHVRTHGNCRMLVAPDHITAIHTKTHATGAVPFVVCGAGIEPNGATAYSERAAQQTGLHLAEGYQLVQKLLQAAHDERLTAKMLAQ